MTTWKRLRHYGVLACAVGLAAGPMHGEDKSIDWHGDYRAALRQARQERKPMLVEFRCEA